MGEWGGRGYETRQDMVHWSQPSSHPDIYLYLGPQLSTALPALASLPCVDFLSCFRGDPMNILHSLLSAEPGCLDPDRSEPQPWPLISSWNLHHGWLSLDACWLRRRFWVLCLRIPSAERSELSEWTMTKELGGLEPEQHLKRIFATQNPETADHQR